MLVRSVVLGANCSNRRAPAAVVYLCDARAASNVAAKPLMELFNLSNSQAALVLQLVQGRTLSEAASELGFSEHTARTYSKHIFAKTRTKGQVDLVRLILASVALVAD